MRTISAAMLLTVLFTHCQHPSATAITETDVLARARQIHDNVLTIDTHDDIPPNFATDQVDPGSRGDRQVDLPKMQEGGLDVGFFIVFVLQTERTPENYRTAELQARVKFEAIHRMTGKMYPEQIELAYTPNDVERIHQSGKLVACIGIENGYVIGRNLRLLSEYFDLGARYMTLAHGGHNDIADSATPRTGLGEPQAEHNGVSKFGEQVIAEMNRLGMMVDISHTSKQSMLDAVRLSKAPVIASHSGIRSLCDHPRNLDDEQLLALRGNGGVVQAVALGAFVKETPADRREALRRLYRDFGIRRRSALPNLSPQRRQEFDRRMQNIDQEWPPATVRDFVDHIDYAVDLIGVDYVGISSDFDGGGGVVGWNDASETFQVTLELVRRGYTEEDIAKLWGGNLLRVWREVESVARQLRESTQKQYE